MLRSTFYGISDWFTPKLMWLQGLRDGGWNKETPPSQAGLNEPWVVAIYNNLNVIQKRFIVMMYRGFIAR